MFYQPDDSFLLMSQNMSH